MLLLLKFKLFLIRLIELCWMEIFVNINTIILVITVKL
jgi:hypothetical protein